VSWKDFWKIERYPMIRKAIKISLYFLLVFLILPEILLRSVGYHYCPLKLERLSKEVDGLGKTEWRIFHSTQDPYFEYDSYLIWRPKKNFKIFNAQGFRGEVLALNKKGKEYRIFAIGDSNTLGPTENSGWPEYLGELFKKDNHNNVKVINAGVWGYSSFQGTRRFEDTLPYKPDMIIISFGSNDAHRVTISDREYVLSKMFFEYTAHLRVCQLFIALSDKVLLSVRKDSLLVPRVNLQEYEENICRIITIAKKNNIKVILLTRPFIGKSHHPLWWKNFIPQYNALTLKIARQRGVASIDVYQYFKDKNEYFVDESHFNDAGYQIAARLIYNNIKDEFR